MKDKNKTPCEGWWDQNGFGRQSMFNLYLRFDSGTVSGSGHDIIGLFTLAGTITDQGHIAMVKQYLGQHTVDYVGTYDGEGVLWGEWHIGPLSDRWMIKIKRSRVASNQTTLEEIV